MERFDFEFAYPLAAPLALAGITPRTAHVDVGEGQVHARFGPWVLRTAIDNVAEVTITGPYRWWSVMGVRLSLSDRGITFGTSTRKGLCLGFARAVPALIPLKTFRHPALTVTVTDPEGLSLAIRRGG